MVTLVVGLTYLTLLIPKLTVGCDLDFVCMSVHACLLTHACVYV